MEISWFECFWGSMDRIKSFHFENGWWFCGLGTLVFEMANVEVSQI